MAARLGRNASGTKEVSFSFDFNAKGPATPDKPFKVHVRREKQAARGGGIDKQLCRRAFRTEQLADFHVFNP